MSAPTGIDSVTLKAQADASNPLASAWVSANAGSGKTFVLSRRVIRLLLAGTDPGRILCLTFTKAAAAEMASRVFATLATWTKLSDSDLSLELAALEGHPPERQLLAEARRLFARALETPGGLKIQTIHAFCERLLHQFPFEANVAGHFEVLDERNAKVLTEEARRTMLARAAAAPHGVLGQALETVLSLVSDMTHEESIAEFIDKRDRLAGWIATADTLDRAIADLRHALDLKRDDTAEGLRRTILDEAPLDIPAAKRLVGLLAAGSTNDGKAAIRLAPYSTAGADSERRDAWIAFLFTRDGPRKTPVTAATLKQWPGLDALIGDEQARLTTLLDRIATAELFESTAAMLRLADAAIGEYGRLKQRRGVLDFEDLVVKTVTLLARSDASRWVQYKLDRGLDHILVDEAQDTSPRQWQVIRALVEDFFAGAGASETLRTVFAVGDEKQSIFSFQGAVPAWFSRIQRELGGAARDGARAWSDLKLHLSFRSVPVVLAAVDTVFKQEAARHGLSAESEAPEHTARRKDEPGRVTIWPAIAPPAKPQPEDWATPLDTLSEDSPEVRLAKRIADTIRDWLDRGETLDAPDKDGNPRPIRAGGILILTRSRGALTDAINRELKTRGVPIAGADRLRLTEHIAVMDLMALGRVALLPEDDLSLAALLKSPLIGLDEEALFDLAYGRKGSLWEALAGAAAMRGDFGESRRRIEGWRAMADKRDPHAFYARILGAGQGRAAFLSRLGLEAEDVLDEFLAQTLAYEQANVATLEGFLDWLVEGEIEIKRDAETLRDEVRVMTVHGAKGLEADVVFLVDNGTMPSMAIHDPRLLSLGDDDDPPGSGPFVWMRSSRQMPRMVKDRLDRERAKTEEEYRRLLYVGMTRARDRLYVVGLAKRPPDPDRRWHALVSQALAAEAKEVRAADGTLLALEWRPPEAPSPDIGREAESDARVAPPDWATRNAPPPPAERQHLTPSTAFDKEHAVLPTVGGSAVREAALVRGRLIHRLLESLPALPASERQAIGTAYLAAFAGAMDAAERNALLREVMAVMDDPAFAPVFAEGSRAEVEIAGRVKRASGEAAVSGRVDRLAVTSAEVLIVDYKTNRPAPETLQDVPPAYVTQLALYRVILRRLYPGRAVAAALLWTDRAALMEIPVASLDSAESAELAK
jgi:ATP-dependent helicase/nuclease subunit A